MSMHNPRPLERRVRLVGRETGPGILGFGFYEFNELE
jgi:hypothetical protein